MVSRNPSGRKKAAGGVLAAIKSRGKKTGRVKAGRVPVFSGDVLPDFLSLAENSPNMIFINYQGRVVFANRLCEETMGYTKKEFYSPDFDFRCLIAPEYLPAIEKMFAGHMKGQEQGPVEYKLVTREGKKIDAVISTKLVDYDGGKAILGVITDVSHYMKIENMLSRERDLQKMYLDVADVVLVALDLRCRVTAINRKGCDLLGLDESDVIGKDWVCSFIPKEAREKARIALDVFMAGQDKNESYDEGAVLCGNGSRRFIRWSRRLLTGRHGEKIGLLSSGLDITDQRQAEEALRESEKRYRGLFDNAPVGIYRTTPDGRILMANPALVRMLGYHSFADLSRVDLRSGKEGCHADNPRRLFLEQIEREGRVVGLESEWTKADGSVLHVRENSRVIRNESGRILYYEGTVEDVTETKQTRGELERRILLERLITEIAARSVNFSPGDVDAGMIDLLKDLGIFMGDDRSYVFQFSPDGKTMDNTYEWVADGIEAEIENLKGLPLSDFPWLMPQLMAKQVVKIPSVDKLPEEAFREKEEFESEDIRSLVLIPLVCGSSVIGFFGFDSVRYCKNWDDDTVALLKIIGEIIASTLERRRVEEQLRYRLDFEKLIIQISANFVNVDSEDIDSVIIKALGEVGLFCGVDRAFLFQLCGKDEFIRTHWWDASHIKPMPEEQQVINASAIPGVFASFKNGGVVCIGQAEELLKDAQGKGAEELVGRMRDFGMESMICVPLVIGGQISAFVAFSSSQKGCGWSSDIISLMRVVGEIFAAAIDKGKASSDLRSERRLVEALMDSMPDHIYFKDRQSRFVRINKAHAAFFGLSNPSEAIGKTDADFFSRDHSDKALRDEREVIRTGKPIVGVEEKETWEDGTVRWASTTKMPLRDEKGNIIGTFGISRDITKRKLEEEEHRTIQARMQHAQKLESLGVLSGGIAHDFNNLLMGILGNTGLALMDIGPDSPAWESIKKIETVAHRAAELTNQMLAYSGKSKFVIKPIDMTHLVKEMGHLLEVSISKKAKLIYDLADNLPLVDGDSAQVRQIVMNLITNASDAMLDKAGTITLRTSLADCDKAYLSSCYVGQDLVPGRYVCVEVTDTGSGMSVETQTKIFDPFFTTKVKGRGLGLAAVLGIVRSHKGALKVYSELDRGTTFKILLPCSLQQDREAVSVAEQKTDWKASGRALVVDDDDIVLMVTEQILKKLGFEVLKASSAKAGVDLFEKNMGRLSVVVLDVTLPEVTVAEVLRQIRNLSSDVPVLLMSGYSEQSATEDVPEKSYQGFLQKPFNTEALVSKLRDIVRA